MKSVISIFLTILLLAAQSETGAAEWMRLRIRNTIIKVEVVTTAAEQRLGLGNRLKLPDGTGMLFIYQNPDERVMWMKRMRIPIDMVWIRHGIIVHIENNVPAPSIMVNDRSLPVYGEGIQADQVLEVPAGYAKRHGYALGDKVT